MAIHHHRHHTCPCSPVPTLSWTSLWRHTLSGSRQQPTPLRYVLAFRCRLFGVQMVLFGRACVALAQPDPYLATCCQYSTESWLAPVLSIWLPQFSKSLLGLRHAVAMDIMRTGHVQMLICLALHLLPCLLSTRFASRASWWSTLQRVPCQPFQSLCWSCPGGLLLGKGGRHRPTVPCSEP